MRWNCLSNSRYEISFANWRIINSYSDEHKMSFGMEKFKSEYHRVGIFGIRMYRYCRYG